MSMQVPAAGGPDFDWDDAYANGAHIAGADQFPPRWAAAAAAFRKAHPDQQLDIPYGDHPRARLDLFRPAGSALGLVVFVHGGYWMRFDKSSWSHLAQGALAAGWAVALPSYPLAPEARISEITRTIARAVDTVAALVPGPLRLAGHSAGGHLVTRLATTEGGLDPVTLGRLAAVVSISGLHDLRPLLRTKMNDTLGLDEAEAASESAISYAPSPAPVELTAWVGADERPEFIRQSQLLKQHWPDTAVVIEDGTHHFDVIAGLEWVDSPITRVLVGSA